MTEQAVERQPDLEAFKEMVRDSWRAALGHGDFGDEDPFFSIGGHSLAALTVMADLGDRLGARMPSRLLFQHRTVPGLAQAVAQELAKSRGEPPAGADRA